MQDTACRRRARPPRLTGPSRDADRRVERTPPLARDACAGHKFNARGQRARPRREPAKTRTRRQPLALIWPACSQEVCLHLAPQMPVRAVRNASRAAGNAIIAEHPQPRGPWRPVLPRLRRHPVARGAACARRAGQPIAGGRRPGFRHEGDLRAVSSPGGRGAQEDVDLRRGALTR